MHDKNIAFMDWSRSYDNAKAPRRSLDLHETWMRQLSCFTFRFRSTCERVVQFDSRRSYVMNPLNVDIQTDDDYRLAAHCYEPTKPAIAGIVIAPAMAVKQSFYDSFAQFLANEGYCVWTFDYRGIGESQQGSMRSCDADITTWVNADYDAVIKHASTAMADKPLFAVGHSLGGLITPFLPSISNLSGVINIAVGSGAKRHLQPRLQRSTPLLWHVVAPVLSFVFGYFPGARIKVMGDIPRRAMLQWRRWCLNPDYLLDSEPGASAAYANVQCPMISLFFSDDELLLEPGARWLHDAYTGTNVDYRIIDATEIDASKIGHFGFFKPRQEETLWPMVSSWVDQQLSLEAISLKSNKIT